jgi:transcriptional regulator
MHPNPAFRQTPAEDALRIACERGFGVLSVNGGAGPLAAHVPFEIIPDGTAVTLHLARSNAIARAALPLPALLVVPGPDACVSPDG